MGPLGLAYSLNHGFFAAIPTRTNSAYPALYPMTVAASFRGPFALFLYKGVST
jgi:hypothetical protein